MAEIPGPESNLAAPVAGRGWWASLGWAAITGCWFGLVGGLVEAVVVGFRRRALGQLVFLPEFFWWAGPIVSAVTAAAGTIIVVALLGGFFPRFERRIRAAIGASYLVLTVLLLVGKIAPWAAAILALGIGIRLASWLDRRGLGFDRLVLRSLPVLVLVGPVLTTAAFRLSNQRSAVAVGSAPPSYNVLLIVLDTVRALELSLYGDADHPATSPVIDSIARHGVVFERASSTAPWTGSSHASLFTGEPAQALSISWNRPLDGSHQTLAEALSKAGYRTGGFVGNTEYTSRETGLARGFDSYQDYQPTASQVIHLTGFSRLASATLRRWLRRRADLPGRVDAASLNERVARWLAEPGDGRPFFAFVNYYDAHAPYFAPQPFWDRFLPSVPRTPLDVEIQAEWAAPDAEIRHRAYAASVAALDAQLGALLDTLRARGTLDRTFVVITADHGEEFAEHGVMGHGNSLYRPGIHVPLIIVGPRGVPAACRVEVPVSGRDLPATVMDLLGLDGQFPGKSLVGTWTDTTPTTGELIPTSVDQAANLPDRYPVSGGPVVGLQLGRLRLIRDSRRTELFDVVTDPHELADLARDPGYGPALATLSTAVLRPPGGPVIPVPSDSAGARFGLFRPGCAAAGSGEVRLKH